MKPISELQFGFRDAENYRSKDQKELFNKIFIRTHELDNLCRNTTYFLLGEKGTGKTALAMYLNNNEYKNTLSRINYIRETDYQKFIILKNEHHLTLSDYSSIWKVIIYLLISEKIYQTETGILSNPIFDKFKKIKEAIDSYYKSAFSPEIIYALNFIDKSNIAAEVISKFMKIGGSSNSEVSFSEKTFQINLLYIKKQFEDAFKSLKLKKNHLLFIDGIDIRPNNIPYSDYLECIKGLSNAIWEINTDFFSQIKDSNGRMRVVLLMRPDIFASMGLQNMNNKYRDNSVLLDWRTTYPGYRNSAIFDLIDKLLSSQQSENHEHGYCWDYYFPYQIKYSRIEKKNDNSFIEFLRYSLYRPRDIIAMLELLQMNYIQRNNTLKYFRKEDFDDFDFKKKYSDYRLGEIKDHLAFYYNENDYELFLRFFTFLNGNFRFTYEIFCKAFNSLIGYIKKNKYEIPIFCESSDIFLQFLYNANVICYIENTGNEKFIRWCFRERDYSNISPKVKTGLIYEIHYGLSKALNVGKEIK